VVLALLAAHNIFHISRIKVKEISARRKAYKYKAVLAECDLRCTKIATWILQHMKVDQHEMLRVIYSFRCSLFKDRPSNSDKIQLLLNDGMAVGTSVRIMNMKSLVE
jgi:hypothetical protein